MRQELNLRPAVLETAALTGLSYAPKSFRPNTLGCRTEGTLSSPAWVIRQKVSLPPDANLENKGVRELTRGTAECHPR